MLERGGKILGLKGQRKKLRIMISFFFGGGGEEEGEFKSFLNCI